MPHLPPAHHETSKHGSPSETKIKEKQNKTIPDSNSILAKSMTHHNQTKELTTWFLTVSNNQSCAYAPYIMKMIEKVSKQIFVKNIVHTKLQPNK
jgi:hypothetical protein